MSLQSGSGNKFLTEKAGIMKKRILSSLSVVLVLCLMVCGVRFGTQTAKLNIIDDNYRNYYEIFVGSYYDSDGDGMGDLNGVTEKLDYIQDMGFNGIWLMPVMPSPSYHKYDVEDYENIDPDYGTLDDFENLLNEAHERGIRVIIDFEMNHSSSEHPWFTQACDYLRSLKGAKPNADDCPYFDYYHFTEDPGSGYSRVTGTNWYYESEFSEDMPDLNLESDAVKDEFEDIASFWINEGVDGFRMDAAMHFEEGNTQFNIDTLNWFYDYCTSLDPDFYMVSEVWAAESTIAEYYKSDTNSFFNFSAGSGDGAIISTAKGIDTAEGFVNSMVTYQTDFSANNPDYIDAPFITNHDQTRVSNCLVGNEDEMKFAGGLLLTMSGSPFVYYGEEIGMASKGDSDPNKRLPFIWSDTDDTGMTEVPAGADRDVESHFPGLDAQQKDDTSINSYYKQALLLRNQNPEIARGTVAIVDSLTKDNTAAITKTYNDSTIGIIYNSAEDAAEVDISGTELDGMKIAGYLTTDNSRIKLSGGRITMPARSIVILK